MKYDLPDELTVDADEHRQRVMDFQRKSKRS